MPTKEEIYKYWRDLDAPVPYSIPYTSNHQVKEKLACFACGFPFHVHRAHIEPKWVGGSDQESNLHLLCPSCHVESEGLSGGRYRSFLDGKRRRSYKHPVIQLFEHMRDMWPGGLSGAKEDYQAALAIDPMDEDYDEDTELFRNLLAACDSVACLDKVLNPSASPSRGINDATSQ